MRDIEGVSKATIHEPHCTLGDETQDALSEMQHTAAEPILTVLLQNRSLREMR